MPINTKSLHVSYKLTKETFDQLKVIADRKFKGNQVRAFINVVNFYFNSYPEQLVKVKLHGVDRALWTRLIPCDVLDKIDFLYRQYRSDENKISKTHIVERMIDRYPIN